MSLFRKLSAIALCFSMNLGVAYADTEIYAVPTNWRLQDYTGGYVSAYYTGSTCPSQGITMPASSTIDDKNRFIAMVMTAKVTGRPMGVYYETTSGNCNITSFYLQG